jgi:hypothetical protein
MYYLKQSTAGQEVSFGPFVDETDGKTAETGLTIANTDIKIHVAGATTLANKNSGGATHIAGGVYYAVFDATDTATLGSGAIIIHVAGALPVRVPFTVLAANIYDSLIGGGDLLDVNVEQWNATNVPAEHTAGYPVVTIKDGTGTGEVDTTSGVVKTNLDVASTEPTGVPGATDTPLVQIARLHMALRNKVTVTATKKTFYDDSDAAEWEQDLSDDGTTFTQSEANAI